jgi:type III secretory pathway lipoprotein EscJ
LSDDQFVCIFRGNRLEANSITALLQANGLDAVLSADDAGGTRPDVGFVQGTRVLVRASDLDDAKRLIDEAEPIPT